MCDVIHNIHSFCVVKNYKTKKYKTIKNMINKLRGKWCSSMVGKFAFGLKDLDMGSYLGAGFFNY